LTAAIGYPQGPVIIVENFHLAVTAGWPYGNVRVRPARTAYTDSFSACEQLYIVGHGSK
jgi:hypothetical protein